MALHTLMIIVLNFDKTMLQGLIMGFPSVYVQVRQPGAWKLHITLYNSIALIGVIYNHPNFSQLAHFGRILEFCGHDSNDSASQPP